MSKLISSEDSGNFEPKEFSESSFDPFKRMFIEALILKKIEDFNICPICKKTFDQCSYFQSLKDGEECE